MTNVVVLVEDPFWRAWMPNVLESSGQYRVWPTGDVSSGVAIAELLGMRLDVFICDSYLCTHEIDARIKQSCTTARVLLFGDGAHPSGSQHKTIKCPCSPGELRDAVTVTMNAKWFVASRGGAASRG
jgi:hypothetical protein